MAEIVANIILKDVFNRRFQSRITLPEFPRVGQRVWLRINDRLTLLKVVKRHCIAEGEDFIEFDFKRCLFVSFSADSLIGWLEGDPKWRKYYLNEFGDKKFASQEEHVA